MQNLYNVPLSFDIEIDLAAARKRGADEVAVQALRLAIEDLAHGRLAIGADAASGLGYLKLDGDWQCPAFDSVPSAAGAQA